MEEAVVYADRETMATEVALFRHSLVAELASPHLERGELTRELRKIARRKHRIPGSRRRNRVSVTTLRRWLGSYRRGGLQALKPGLRADHGVSRVIPEQWLKRAVALRHEVPSRSARVLVEILERLPEYPGINPHTLDKALKRLGATRKLLGKPKPRTRRWSARHVNDLWQGDATDGVWLPEAPNSEGKIQTTLFLWLDDVSRLVVHAEFFFDEKLPRMERTLKIALLRRGVPLRNYVDNGNVYIALQYKAALAELKIKPVHTRVRRPQGRGKIERIFRVIQDDFYPEVYKAKIQTLSDLNESLWAWLECVYHNRVHSELKRTPLEVYRDGLEGIRVADPVEVARAFLWRFKRKVSANGFVSLFGNTYSVDPTWAGRTLELRCDPFDLARMDVYQERCPVARAHVKILKKARCLEIEPLRLPPPTEPSGVSYLDLLRAERRTQQAAEVGKISYREALIERNNKEEG
jgi:transposase InsO family protein